MEYRYEFIDNSEMILPSSPLSKKLRSKYGKKHLKLNGSPPCIQLFKDEHDSAYHSNIFDHSTQFGTHNKLNNEFYHSSPNFGHKPSPNLPQYFDHPIYQLSQPEKGDDSIIQPKVSTQSFCPRPFMQSSTPIPPATFANTSINSQKSSLSTSMSSLFSVPNSNEDVLPMFDPNLNLSNSNKNNSIQTASTSKMFDTTSNSHYTSSNDIKIMGNNNRIVQTNSSPSPQLSFMNLNLLDKGGGLIFHNENDINEDNMAEIERFSPTWSNIQNGRIIGTPVQVRRPFRNLKRKLNLLSRDNLWVNDTPSNSNCENERHSAKSTIDNKFSYNLSTTTENEFQTPHMNRRKKSSAQICQEPEMGNKFSMNSSPSLPVKSPLLSSSSPQQPFKLLTKTALLKQIGNLRESQAARYFEEFIEIEQLGSGHFGNVFKCRNRLDGCLYAIKKSRTPLTLSSSFTEYTAIKEVCAHAILGNHPHIVRYFSAWAEDGTVFIQNEYCNGGTLADLNRRNIANQTQVSEHDLKLIALHVGKGLKYFHSLKLAHLDIKPSNIFITRCSPTAVLNNSDEGFESDDEKHDSMIFKIGDLGLVTSIHDPEVEEGDARYLPLEILHEDYSDITKADIFSLGMSLFETAINKPLQPNGEEWQILRTGNIPYISSYTSQFNLLLKSMLNPVPSQRPTASNLIHNPLLCPLGCKSKTQLKRELNAERFKNTILAKQLEDAQTENMLYKRQCLGLDNNYALKMQFKESSFKINHRMKSSANKPGNNMHNSTNKQGKLTQKFCKSSTTTIYEDNNSMPMLLPSEQTEFFVDQNSQPAIKCKNPFAISGRRGSSNLSLQRSTNCCFSNLTSRLETTTNSVLNQRISSSASKYRSSNKNKMFNYGSCNMCAEHQNFYNKMSNYGMNPTIVRKGSVSDVRHFKSKALSSGVHPLITMDEKNCKSTDKNMTKL